MIASQSLSAKEVYHSCDLSLFDFKTTSELDPLSKPIGQDRALEAIEFGIDIKHPGFHIFALGPPGVGKHQLVNSILARRNVDTSTLFDWCYVNNFEDPQKPLLLKLDAGMGTELSKNMLQLVEDILISLPSAFQNEEYRNQRGEIEEAMNQRYEKTFSKLSADAKEQNIALVRTPAGFTLTPVVNDNIITPEEFSKLPVDERKRIEKVVAELQVELQQVVSRLPLLRREASHDIQELNRSVTRLTVEQYVGWLENQYQEYPEIIQFLTAVKDFAIENAEAFLPHEDNPNNEQVKQRAREFTSLRVNVIVDNTKANEVPLIFEDNPTYQNLIGRVEYESEMGNFQIGRAHV